MVLPGPEGEFQVGVVNVFVLTFVIVLSVSTLVCRTVVRDLKTAMYMYFT